MSCGYGAVIKNHYDRIWERLPDELDPPHFELRCRFLMGEAIAGRRALDLGCGTGVFTAVLARAGAAAVGVDVAEAALRRARVAYPELDFRMMTIGAPLPFEDGAFDLVWTSEVIEHIADTERWLAEVRRVLASGGRLLLTTPNHPRASILFHGLERYSEPLGDHLHLYTRRSLQATLAELGFERIAVRTVGGPPLARQLLLASSSRP